MGLRRGPLRLIAKAAGLVELRRADVSMHTARDGSGNVGCQFQQFFSILGEELLDLPDSRHDGLDLLGQLLGCQDGPETSLEFDGGVDTTAELVGHFDAQELADLVDESFVEIVVDLVSKHLTSPLVFCLIPISI